MNRGCCFCKLPVLGIFGQDDNLDTYNLLDEEEDRRAVAEEVFGSCHMKCLLSSTWNDFWVRRRLGNYVNPRGFKLTYEGSDGRIFRHDRTGQNVAVLASGAMLGLSDRTVKSGRNAEDHSVRVEQSALFWDLPAPLKEARVQDLFDPEGHMPLLRLAESLGVVDKFRDPEQAARARLRMIEGQTATRLRQGVLVADLSCSVSLPDRLFAQLTAFAAAPSAPKVPAA